MRLTKPKPTQAKRAGRVLIAAVPLPLIQPGQQWESDDGMVVTIEAVSRRGLIRYSFTQRGEFHVSERANFPFQMRYAPLNQEHLP